MSILYFDAFTRFGPKPSMHGMQPWTLDQLVAEMQHCSISGALVSATACLQYDALLENRRLSAKLARYDHLFPLWNVAPHWTDEMPEPAELTRLMVEANVRAVTLCPKNNGWNLFSKTSRPLLQELERTRTLSILDLRTEIDAAGLETLAEQHPALPILMVGVSWGLQCSILPLLRLYKNLHIAFDHFQISNGLEWLTAKGCEDQLVYASNATDMAMGAHRAYVDYADLPETVKTKIASGNLIRLLKGLKPPRASVNREEDSLMAEARAGKPLSTLVLDMHAHILDEGLNGAGRGYVMQDGGPSGQQRLARRMGVKGIGLMSWNGTVGVHADEGNACVRAALDAAPDLFWGLATPDVMHETPDVMRQKLEVLFADRRFLGLKPYVSFGRQYDDPAYEPLWRFGNERGLYALLHANRGDLSEFDALCPKYPNITFVAAHCGASYQAADYAIQKARKHRNFMIEITLTPVCMGVIDYLAAGAGAERVLYGSDQPMRDPRQQMGWVVFSRLPLEAKRQVLGLNAQALLDRVRAGQKM